MTTLRTPMDAASRALATVEQLVPLNLSVSQRYRLLWIIQRNGVPAVWSSGSDLAPGAGCTIVVDVPNGLECERFLQSLGMEAIVILPYSEDPLFDTLKANLCEYGTIGASGAEGPHQLWWGGRRADCISHDAECPMPLIVSCYAPGILNPNKVRRLILSADTLKLRHSILQDDAIALWETGSATKVRHIWNTWVAAECPVLWVEPDAMLNGYPALPAALDCDFAIHKRDNHAFDGSVLYFGQSSVTEALLQTWHRLCLTCPGVSDEILLDQAWSLVSSQCGLDTVWLPRSYCGRRSAWLPGEDPLIVRDDSPRLLLNLNGELLPLLEHDLPATAIAARGYARTGAPEAQLVMRAETGEHGPVAVLVHDSHATRPSSSSAVIEAIAAAFASDSGGFSHLEIVLCPSTADFDACTSAMQDFWIVVTTPAERFGRNTFRIFGDAIHSGEVRETSLAQELAPDHDFRQDQSPPARVLSNVKQSETFLMRASPRCAAETLFLM